MKITSTHTGGESSDIWATGTENLGEFMFVCTPSEEVRKDRDKALYTIQSPL